MFFHNILIIWNCTQQKKWKWSNTICYNIDDSKNNDSEQKVLILGYGVHKIRENEFKSIVTITRFFWCLR